MTSDDTMLEQLGEALAALGERVGGGGLAEGSRQATLHRYLAQLEYAVARSAASFEADGGHIPDGAQTAAAWIATICHVPEAAARREIRHGRALSSLPATAAAFAAGEIGSAQVGVIERLHRGRCRDAVKANEELLVSQARELRFSHFERAAAYFAQHADPDGAEDADMARRARRDVSLSPSIGGMWFGQMTLDPISGEIIHNELARLEHLLYLDDLAEARRRLGREPLTGELSRSCSQRRCDALVEMARRSAGSPDGGSPAPLLTVLVGYETLRGRICELASGIVVSPGSLLALLDEALVERVVFSPNRRIEVGMRRRFFSGATRRAIEVRDQRCTHPFCDRPASQCQVDHSVPYEAGGLTTQEGGRLLCDFHNRLAYREWCALDEATRQARIEAQRRAAEAAVAAGSPGGPDRAETSGPDRAPPSDGDGDHAGDRTGDRLGDRGNTADASGGDVTAADADDEIDERGGEAAGF